MEAEWREMREMDICPEKNKQKKHNPQQGSAESTSHWSPVSLRKLMSRLFVSAVELVVNSSVDTFLNLRGHVAVMLFVKLSGVMSRVSSAACRALTVLVLWGRREGAGGGEAGVGGSSSLSTPLGLRTPGREWVSEWVCGWLHKKPTSYFLWHSWLTSFTKSLFFFF